MTKKLIIFRFWKKEELCRGPYSYLSCTFSKPSVIPRKSCGMLQIFYPQNRCSVRIFPSGRNTKVRNHRGSRGHPVPEPSELSTLQGPSSNTTNWNCNQDPVWGVPHHWRNNLRLLTMVRSARVSSTRECCSPGQDEQDGCGLWHRRRVGEYPRDDSAMWSQAGDQEGSARSPKSSWSCFLSGDSSPWGANT